MFLMAVLRMLDAFSGLVIFRFLATFCVHTDSLLQVEETATIVCVCIFIFFHFNNVYRSFRFSSFRYEIHMICLACFSLFIVLIIIGYITRLFFFLPRACVIYWMVLWPIFIFMVRIAMRGLLRSIRRKGYNLKKAVIAGKSKAGITLAKHIYGNSWTGTDVVGFFNDDATSDDSDINDHFSHIPCLGNLGALIQYIETHDVDILYIALNGNDEDTIRKLVQAVDRFAISVHYIPNVFFLDLVMGSEIIFFDQRPVIVLKDTPIYGLSGLIKRLTDIVVSALVLMLTAPILLLIALCIKIDSRGSVFFVQARYGINGEKINIYKFRTMFESTQDPPGVYHQATKNDDRITPVGRFLRKSSLDELPQFINVFQGRMSLVGPRPHPVAMNEQYRKIISGYMVRHKVKPGITGLAQVKGFRGETDTLEKMEKRVECDLRYIREWSVLFDMEIMVRTLIVFLFQKNAY